MKTLSCTLLAFLIVGCATPKQTFLHKSHRENFALQADELEGVQFYISTEVLARDEIAGDTPAGVIILPVGTPGAVTEVGPNWLRVSFSAQGEGAYFVTVPDPASPDSAYWLATRVEQGSEPVRVKDLDDKVIHTRAGDFRVVYGDAARLLIDSRQLQELIAKRTHLPGRAPQ